MWIFAAKLPIEDKIQIFGPTLPEQLQERDNRFYESTHHPPVSMHWRMFFARSTAMQILPLSTKVVAAGICEIAERRLHESPYFFLRSLRCEFDNGVLTLRGQVPLGQLKQFAEAIVARIDGVRLVINRVEVFDPMAGPLSGPTARNAG